MDGAEKLGDARRVKKIVVMKDHGPAGLDLRECVQEVRELPRAGSTEIGDGPWVFADNSANGIGAAVVGDKDHRRDGLRDSTREREGEQRRSITAEDDDRHLRAAR